MAEDLQQIWSNGLNPASFSGELGLARATRANRGFLRKKVFPYLNTYTLFKSAKKPKTYNPYFTRVLRKDIQSDLIFMNNPPIMVKHNKGYKYILIVQDVFSRKIWTRALKDKTGKTIENQLNDILTEMAPFHENARFIIDRGTEYLNTAVKNILNNHGVAISHPSDGHASHVERANLSLQRLLYQKMTEVGGTRKWLEFLPQATNIINTRKHRIIKMTPNEAENIDNHNRVNEAMSLYRLKAVNNSKKREKKKKKFKIGDMVRLQADKGVFKRGYLPTFTKEIFKISEILDHLPVTMYSVKEWDGTPIHGNFYPEELTLVKGDVFKIEKIIRRGKPNGVPSRLVKWEGFASKYNQWVPETDFV